VTTKLVFNFSVRCCRYVVLYFLLYTYTFIGETKHKRSVAAPHAWN